MARPHLQHRRTHNLLLFRKLLECRENASLFTLILDSLEKGARPLLRELVAGANSSKVKTLFVSFETAKSPPDIDTFISARAAAFDSLRHGILEHITGSSQRHLIVFDSINVLTCLPNAPQELSSFLSSFISPTCSFAAVYHLDSPAPHDSSAYSPPPLALLKYLATTILSTHSLSHVLAARRARSRSLAEPARGLTEEKEGVIAGLGCNDARGTVIEMEYRRRSGRAVHEVFFIPSRGARSTKSGSADGVILLEDHAEYRAAAGDTGLDSREEVPGQHDGEDGTFNLGLTAKQRADREGVVLPYFDAQNSAGVGEGGRILYDMGVEDDFDEEEDEI